MSTNPKDFYAVLMDGHYDILLHNGDYKKDILAIHFWPQAADLEAEADEIKGLNIKTTNKIQR